MNYLCIGKSINSCNTLNACFGFLLYFELEQIKHLPIKISQIMNDNNKNTESAPMSYIESLRSDNFSFEDKLQIWAEEAIKYCHPMAEKLDRAFYAFQSKTLENPRLLLLGLNPGGRYGYEHKMTPEMLLEQNSYYFGGSNYEPRKPWTVLKKLNITRSATREIDGLFNPNTMVYMNLLYFNSSDLAEFLTHAESKNENGQEVFDKCAQLTKDLIFNIIKPKRIICLGIDSCFDLLNSGNETVDEIVPNVLHQTTIEGVDIYGITHPAYRFSTDLERKHTGYYLSHEIFGTIIPNSVTESKSEYIRKLSEIELPELQTYLQKEIGLDTDGQLHFTANNGDELSLRVCTPKYFGIRARHKYSSQYEEWNDGIQKEKYIEPLHELDFEPSRTWLGIKYYKKCNCATIEELGQKIAADFNSFKAKIEL